MSFSVSGALISMTMNGLPSVDLPSSRNRTRSLAPATCRMYSTILSQRASLLSEPIRKPKNCSGVASAPGAWAVRRGAAPAMTSEATIAASDRVMAVRMRTFPADPSAGVCVAAPGGSGDRV